MKLFQLNFEKILIFLIWGGGGKIPFVDNNNKEKGEYQ